ncbi:MAG: hypothetical protein U5Q44_04815 [Dehalococcoidia bacterium]|nr:hypothetical protein [Dehalococcoidia bacterium]
MLSALGRREWFALVAFAFSVLVASTFLSATAHDDIAPRTPWVGEPLPSPSVAVEPTQEARGDADELRAMAAPSDGWRVRYLAGESGELVQDAWLRGLSLEFDGAPLPELTDDAWRLEAGASVDMPRGLYEFVLVYQGAVRVSVDGTEVASARSGGSGAAQELRVQFAHDGGEASIVDPGDGCRRAGSSSRWK